MPLGTINVQSGSTAGRVKDSLQEAARAGLDFCGMQEMRQLNSDLEEHEVVCPVTGAKSTWVLYWIGHKSLRRDGVAIAIKKNKSILVRDWLGVTARLMWMDLTVFGLKIRIVCGYAPTNVNKKGKATPESSRLAFWSDVSSASKVTTGQVCFMGDCNATAKFDRRFNMRSDKTGADGFLTDLPSDNGKLLTDFTIAHDFTIMNTHFEHPKRAHRHTWYMHQKDGKLFSKTVDYVVMSKWLANYVRDCRVKRDFFSSDHRLLVTRMATPCCKGAYNNFKKKAKTKRFDYAKLRGGVEGCDQTKADFNTALDNLVAGIDDPSVIDCEKLVDILAAATEKAVPILERTPEQSIWEDTELKQLKLDRIKINRSSNPELWRDANNRYKRRISQLENQIYSKQADELNFLGETRRIERQYKKLKTADVIGKKIADKKPEGLKEHFKEHFNGDKAPEQAPEAVRNPPSYITDISDFFTFEEIDQERLERPPDKAEIQAIVRSMKSKKAFTDVAPEVLKLAIENEMIVGVVELIMKDVWDTLEVPNGWRKTDIHPLYKNKGSKMDCKNWRGLAIGSTILKVCMSIILDRTSGWYNATLHPAQTGFRKGYGCSTATYDLHMLHHIYKRQKKPLWALFLDFKAAYDWLGRDHVFQCIYNRCGDNQALIQHFKIIESLYSLTKSKIDDDDEEDDEIAYFLTTLGLRQGGSESPSCYNLYADAFFRVFEHECKKKGIGAKIGTKVPEEIRKEFSADDEVLWELFVLLGYADDTVVFAESLEDLQAAADILEDLLKDFGLRLSVDKTKSMEFLPLKNPYTKVSDREEAEKVKISHLKMYGGDIEHVDSFKYLGSFKTDDEPGVSDKEISYRIGLATGKFNSLKRILCNHRVKLNTRIKFYDCFIKSRLLYSCETWAPTQRQLERIESAHLKFLRHLVVGGHDKRTTKREIQDLKLRAHDEEDEVKSQEILDLIDWRPKLLNTRILEICRVSTLTEYIKSQNLRFIAHQCRLPDWAYSKKLTFSKNPQTLGGNRQQTVYERVLKDKKIKSTKTKKLSKPESTFLKWCMKDDQVQPHATGGEVLSENIVEET